MLDLLLKLTVLRHTTYRTIVVKIKGLICKKKKRKEKKVCPSGSNTTLTRRLEIGIYSFDNHYQS